MCVRHTETLHSYKESCLSNSSNGARLYSRDWSKLEQDHTQAPNWYNNIWPCNVKRSTGERNTVAELSLPRHLRPDSPVCYSSFGLLRCVYSCSASLEQCDVARGPWGMLRNGCAEQLPVASSAKHSLLGCRMGKETLAASALQSPGCVISQECSARRKPRLFLKSAAATACLEEPEWLPASSCSHRQAGDSLGRRRTPPRFWFAWSLLWRSDMPHLNSEDSKMLETPVQLQMLPAGAPGL